MRTLIKSLITLWVTLSVSMGSYGDTFTGNDMQGMCSHEQPEAGLLGVSICHAYIMGFNEMHNMQAVLFGGDYIYCLPDGWEYSQLAKVANKQMAEHPETLHLPYYATLMGAFTAAFPCEEE